MNSKIKILAQNLGLWKGHFDHFQGQKTRFLGFLKVALELFKSRLTIVLGFKAQLSVVFLARKVDIWPLKSKL